MNPLLKLWYLAEFAVAQTLLFFVGHAPLRLVLALARGAADLAFLAWRERRKIAIENLLLTGIAPDAPGARRLARASFRHFVTMVVEAVLVRQRLTPDNWRDFVTLKISPAAEALLTEPGRGLIVASAHIGNWEVTARAVSVLKPLCVIYRPFNNPYLNRALHQGRSGERLRLISRLERDPMRFLQALAAGEVLALMIDQHAGGEAARVSVNFFGRPAWTTKTVAMLHLATRAPLLGAFTIRTGPLRYEVHTIGPVRCQRTGQRDLDAQAITQSLTDEIEKIARRHPEQYMWGHRRWKE